MSRNKRRRLQVEELESRLVLSTYYVATSGSDANPGDGATPFATLQHAADLVQAGDTVVVRAGSYAGFIMGWDVPTAGTSSAPITFEADPNAPAGSVVINARNSKTASGIDLEPGCDWITVAGFSIQGAGGIGTYPNHGSGIKVTGDHDSVLNNTVTGIDYGFGILTDGANNVLLRGNTVSGTGNHGNADYGHGIYLSGTTTGAVVEDNVLHDNAYIGLHINGDPSTTGGSGLVSGALIARNLIYSNGQNGINADGIQSSTIENNVIYGYDGFGIALYQIDASGPSSNNVIVNNTIVSTNSGAGAAVRILDGGTGNALLNNVLLGGSGIAYRISSDSLSGLTSDYNVTGGTYQSEDTSATQSLASWQTQTGQDAHSFTASASALFADAAGNDYHLSATSPAIGAASATDAPATDLDGNARPQGNRYDIGAYQYVGTPAPSAASFTVSAPSAATAGTSFQVTVSALDSSNNMVTGYRGTVHFTSSDGQAVLPADYAFTSADAGKHTFTVTLETASSQTVTVSDTAHGSATGNTSILVSPVVSAAQVLPTAGSTVSIWDSTATPAREEVNDPNAVELGIKFRSDVAGYVTGVRFYKGQDNTGPHLGNVWTADGQLLATAEFTAETAGGWQQVTFSSPVAINPNTTYIASYHTDVGYYSATNAYFASSGAGSGSVHALADGTDGADGLYEYGGSAFPTSSYQSTNYWVDVLFTPQTGTAPKVVSETPYPETAAVATSTTVSATFNESVQPGSLGFVLRDSSNRVVAATLSYDDSTHTATLTPVAALANGAVYTATVTAAQDPSGGTLAAPVSWSFTTATVTSWQQSTAADFGTGTRSGTTVADPADGGLQFRPTLDDQFAGSSLGSSWTTTAWTSGGAATVAGGSVSLAGAGILSTQAAAGAAAEGLIAFGAAPYQHFGLATGLDSAQGNYWALFSTFGTSDTLYARVNVNGATTDVRLGALPSGFHDYKVQPVSGGFQFSIDGVLKTTIQAHVPASKSLRVALSAYGTSNPLRADWVRLDSYPSSGTFTSTVYDATRVASWGAVSWAAKLPAGTKVTVQTRSGNTATPDGTWSAWSSVSNSGTVSSPSGRYLQHRIILTTSKPGATPTLFSIDFDWT